MKRVYYFIIFICYSLSLNAQLEQNYLDSIWSEAYKITQEKQEFKNLTIQLDSSISYVKSNKSLTISKTKFNSGRSIHIDFTSLKDIVKISVTDSCDYDQLGIYDYLIEKDVIIHEGLSHTVIPCIAYELDDLGKEWSEEYHYKSEDIQKFCLDLFDRIQITKKTIFLD